MLASLSPGEGIIAEACGGIVGEGEVLVEWRAGLDGVGEGVVG
jgi:hypothetical protein